jgi:hypothetical protein
MTEQDLILLLFVTSVITNAVADGLRIRHISNPYSKIIGNLYHYFWAATILALLCLLLVDIPKEQLLRHVVAYSLLRFGAFDYIVNIASGKHYMYLGTTSSVDRLLHSIFKTPNSMVILGIIRSILFILGMFLVQYYNEYF